MKYDVRVLIMLIIVCSYTVPMSNNNNNNESDKVIRDKIQQEFSLMYNYCFSKLKFNETTSAISYRDCCRPDKKYVCSPQGLLEDINGIVARHNQQRYVKQDIQDISPEEIHEIYTSFVEFLCGTDSRPSYNSLIDSAIHARLTLSSYTTIQSLPPICRLGQTQFIYRDSINHATTIVLSKVLLRTAVILSYIDKNAIRNQQMPDQVLAKCYGIIKSNRASLENILKSGSHEGLKEALKKPLVLDTLIEPKLEQLNSIGDTLG